MKKYILGLFLALVSVGFAAAPQYINTTPGAGDTGISGGNKINENFANLLSGSIGFTDLTVTATATLPAIVGDVVTNANTLYVSVNGNDATAQVGNPRKPWRSITNAVEYMANNRTMLIGPGDYYITPFSRINSDYAALRTNSHFYLHELTNVCVRGSGESTIIYITGLGQGMVINALTNFTFSDFQLNASKRTQTLSTDYFASFLLKSNCWNGTFERIVFNGGSRHGLSCLPAGTTWGYSANNISIRNCRFYSTGCTNISGASGADGTAISGIGSGWTIEGCYFLDNVRDVEIEASDFTTPLQSGLICRGNQHYDTYEFAYAVWGHNTTAGAVRKFGNIVIANNFISNIAQRVTISARNAINVLGRVDNVTIANNIIDGMAGTGTSHGINVGADRTNINNVQILGNIVRDAETIAIVVDEGTGGASISNVVISGNQIIDVDGDGNVEGGYGIKLRAHTGIIANNIGHNGVRGAVPFIWVMPRSSDISVINNRNAGTYASFHWPSFGLLMDALTTNCFSADNYFQGVQSNYQTNGSVIANLPCRIVTAGAPSDTNDPAPPGSTAIDKTNGDLYIMVGTSWKKVTRAS